MQHFNTHKPCCERRLFLIVISLISFQVQSQVFTVDSIMRNGRRPNRVNIAYLSDGYMNAELPTFITNSNTINDALFGTTPFKEYKNFFNAFSIRVPSVQSGAIHPGNGSNEATEGAGQPITNPDIYFKSSFDFGGSVHRLLSPINTVAVSNVLASNLPDYDQGFIVVNSPFYGGAGGTYATASTHATSGEIAIHEIGHSFAGLADEYWAGPTFAAEKPNMTANNDPATIKWKNWLNTNNIGIFAYGAAAPENAWFRPHQNCKMQILGQLFCSVCTERFIDRIHQRVNMIDDATPTTPSFTLSNTNPVSFLVVRVTTTPNTVNATWYLNGVVFATNQSSISIPFAAFTNGANTVRADVIDNTTLSKSYLPGVGYINSTMWSVTKPATLPILLKTFTGLTSNNTGILNWEIESPDDLVSFTLSKSREGIDFSPLAIIPGEKGRKKYNYTDLSLFIPYSYYRLTLVQKDGKELYSSVIRLQNAFDNYYYKVYQNAELHRYHLIAALTNEENISIELGDVSGKILLRKDFGKVAKQLDFNIDLAGKPAGVYFLKINIGNTPHTMQLLAK